MMKQQENATFNGIDLTKFVCSLLIVAIHIPPLEMVDWMLNWAIKSYVARIAVPFFFICSGYFLLKKLILNV